jgi:hypothetical protein
LLERDLQEYLFAHPEVLFPGERIQEKSREFHIQGRRIDLLVCVDDIRYIIELKAVPLSREHIGQVVEYYGLMLDSIKGGNFKMILVAPSIPVFRKVFLEEIGLRCVEISNVPSGEDEVVQLSRESSIQLKNERAELEVASWISNLTSISYDDIVKTPTKESLAISHRMLRDSLDAIGREFAEYEILPIKMARTDSPDVICGGFPATLDSVPEFVRAGVWWAYAFGESEEMPKNDVPNISAMAMPWCLDLAVNAELRTSQQIMKMRVAANPLCFDDLIQEHGGIQLQALLKLEHQPRFYHWIPLISQEPGTWCAQSFLAACAEVERDYQSHRDAWSKWIEKNSLGLTKNQSQHMRKRNKQCNLALRLVRPFRKGDKFWSLPYSDQRVSFVAECRRLKPLIDFLR